MSSSISSSASDKPWMNDVINYLPITSSRTLQLCANRDVDDCDMRNVFISSYPKSGTTWMQAIVYALLSNGNENFEHISNYSPFYEIDPHWEVEGERGDDSGDREGRFSSKFDPFHKEIGHHVFNTHLRWCNLPKGKQARYIYVYRDGKDAATSFYHHLSNQDDDGGYEGSFEQFFEDWISNKIIFGSWIKHLKEFLSAAEDPSNHILVVRYEDMKRDLCACVQRVATFLECNIDPNDIESRIVPMVTFEYMKSNKVKFQPISVKWKNNFEFIRKGQIGDNTSIFSSHHINLFENMLSDEFPDGLPSWLEPC